MSVLVNNSNQLKEIEMTIHQLRLQFDKSFFAVLKDLVKLEAMEEHHVPYGDVPADLGEHLAAHTEMMTQVARLTSPAKPRPLPFVRV